MNEEKKLTSFEQAFFDYREAVRSIEGQESELLKFDEWATRSKTYIRQAQGKRADALAELKRHMTPEAFAELTGADKTVTP